MATRCARCQNEDVTLETFGVFRCPACGRVDADGRSLEVAPPAPVAAANDDPFDAPPPRIPMDVSERARAALTGVETRGPPVWFFGALIVTAILTLASAAGTGSWGSAAIHLAMLGALATGRSWARVLCIALDALSIIAVCVLLVLLRAYVPAFMRPALVVGALIDAAWIYVLFREDTVRYFTRPTSDG